MAGEKGSFPLSSIMQEQSLFSWRADQLALDTFRHLAPSQGPRWEVTIPGRAVNCISGKAMEDPEGLIIFD